MKYALSILLLYMTICVMPYTGFAQEAPPHPEAGYLTRAHAHNDYEHTHPLFDALDYRFYSVESDFWLVDGQLMVSHDKEENIEDYKGTLKELYLDPLQTRVDEMGSVHGDGLPFYLWLDIKDARDEMHAVLHALLKEYSMLSVFTEQKKDERAVTIILTGDHESKSSYVNKYKTRRVCRDSNHYNENDPKADHQWLWYALNWNAYMKWDAQSPMPDSLYTKLVDLVNDIHAKGRKVRFFASPDREEYWSVALRAGVDHINTDKIPELNHFLESKKNNE